jgi:hypothetical protein
MIEEKAPSLGRRLLNGWMAIAGRFGMVQTMVILLFTYVLVLGPVAFGITLSRRDLLSKRGLRSAGSAWCDADSAEPDLERAKLTS